MVTIRKILFVHKNKQTQNQMVIAGPLPPNMNIAQNAAMKGIKLLRTKATGRKIQLNNLKIH
jgi:hypothetical protein